MYVGKALFFNPRCMALASIFQKGLWFQVSKDYSNKILTIPNILSIIRIALIPVIVWAYVFADKPSLAATLLVISGVTDMADGYIARRFNMVSNFGKGLDPVADKLTQFIVLICLVFRYPLMVIPCTVLFIKELISAVTALCAIHNTGKVVGATWHGTVSTILLYAMLFVHIVWFEIPKLYSNIIIWTSVAVMILSFVLYTVRNVIMANKKAKN